ncbi:hypothetical protein, partial [Neisseria cinerea]|uniref:hypothetical protein n=1 Tax=Neisseria cinerea TaxID=483 RepID=UPI00396A0C07
MRFALVPLFASAARFQSFGDLDDIRDRAEYLYQEQRCQPEELHQLQFQRVPPAGVAPSAYARQFRIDGND